MDWDFCNDRPIYSQIIDHMKLFIVSGQLKAGDRLSSVRELAAQAEVNPNTMQKALAELERTGLIYSNRTSGRFITEDEEMIQQIKQELAQESVRLFLQSMKQIGYTADEAIQILENYEKGEKNYE